jgi:hypothetical protein
MNILKNNFLALVEKAIQQTQTRTHMRPVIEKELLHYDILFALDQAGLLDTLTFQGGTALRLCYGAPRYSEDLDFTGGYDFKTQNLLTMKTCLENYLGKRYGLNVTVKEPHEMQDEPTHRNIKISKWQMRIVTHPERRDLPKQMIKIEVGNIPAYTREPRALLANYDFLPDGYADTLILTETLDEILADKVISLANCQTYIRYRDLWDLHWLQQQKAILNLEFVQKKIQDYHIEDYAYKVESLLSRLPSILLSPEFKTQMSRFLPVDVQERTLFKEKFYPFLENTITQLLKQIHCSATKE